MIVLIDVFGWTFKGEWDDEERRNDDDVVVLRVFEFK